MLIKRKYKTKDLFIGYLGVIKKEENKYVCDSKYLQRKIVFLTKMPNCYDECRDVRTGNYYMSFHNVHTDLSNEIGKVLYYRLFPIANFTTQKSFTIKELENWEDRLNNFNKEKKEENIPSTNVAFLDVLLSYKEKIAEINDLEKQNELKLKIIELGKIYAEELMKIKLEKPNNLTLDNPLVNLREMVIEKLALIDMEIDQELSNNNLRDGLKILERSLGSERNDR